MKIKKLLCLVILCVTALIVSEHNASGVDLLKDIFDTRNIDYARFEQKWGYLHHAIMRLNLDERHWEGGDSATIYQQNDLTKWTLEEKRLLAFFLFWNFEFTQREASAIGEMLGADADTICSQLGALNDRDLITAIARGAKSQYTATAVENFRNNLQHLRNSSGLKGK